MNTKHLLFVAFSFLLANTLFAQEKSWQQLMEEGAPFKQVQQAFNKEWKDKPYERGHGYKQYKRWEEFWENRLLPDGSYPETGRMMKEYRAYKAAHSTRSAGDANWTSIGPNTWTNSGSWSPGLGRINVVAVDPNNANTVYVGAPAGGIWKSTDGGTNWTALGDQFSSMGVSGIAIDPNNSNIIYIGTGDVDAGDTYADGVYKSINAGSSWTKIGSITSTRIGKMAVDPSNSNNIFAATNSGFFYSTNSGSTWTEVLATDNIRDFEFKPTDSKTIYLTTSSAFYISTNGGVSFATSGTGLPTSSSKLLIATTAADASYVYVLSANGSNAFGGVYQSTNGGTSFTAKNTTTDIFEGTQSWYDLAFAASQTNKDVLVEGVLNIWKSTNGGTTWTKMNSWSNPAQTSYTHADIHFLDYFGNNLWTGTDGGVYMSTNDATSFTNKSHTIANSQFYRLAGLESNKNILSGGLQDNGGFRYDGTSWKVYHGADGMETALDETNSLIQYGMIQNGTLYYSSNGGTSSSSVGSPKSGAWVTPMQKDPNAAGIIAGYNDLHRYTPGGGGWTQLTSVNTASSINCLEIYKGNSNFIYFSSGSQLYKTTNGGANAATVTGGGWSGSISSIETNPTNSDEVWVSISGFTANNKVYYSTNGGTTWTNFSTGLPNIPCNIVKLDGSSATKGLYVGTDMGVYYRDNTMSSWTTFNDGLPNTIVRDLEINETNDLIRAGTYGRSVWESPTYGSAKVNYDATVTASDVSNAMTCAKVFNPSVTLLNKGDITLTDLDFSFNVDGGTNVNYHWTGSLAKNATTNVVLMGLALPSNGAHSLNVTTSNPNGNTDQNTSNDTKAFAFNFGLGHTITFKISETSANPVYAWTIKEGATLITSSTNHTAVSGGGFKTQQFCLVDQKCYTLTVTDAFISSKCVGIPAWSGATIYNVGDKVTYNGRLYEATSNIWTVAPAGSPYYKDLGACNTPIVTDFYELSDITDNVSLVKKDVASYTSPANDAFCVNPTGITEHMAYTAKITPNPTNGIVRIEALTNNSNVTIYNIMGEKILSVKDVSLIGGYSINLNSYSEGIYTVVVENDTQTQTVKVVKQ